MRVLPLLLLPLLALTANAESPRRKTSAQSLPESRLAKRVEMAGKQVAEGAKARAEQHRQAKWAREEARALREAEHEKQKAQVCLKRADMARKKAEDIRKAADLSWKAFEGNRTHAPAKAAPKPTETAKVEPVSTSEKVAEKAPESK